MQIGFIFHPSNEQTRFLIDFRIPLKLNFIDIHMTLCCSIAVHCFKDIEMQTIFSFDYFVKTVNYYFSSVK